MRNILKLQLKKNLAIPFLKITTCVGVSITASNLCRASLWLDG
jgi:uncharacterized HAD superfamily protein